MKIRFIWNLLFLVVGPISLLYILPHFLWLANIFDHFKARFDLLVLQHARWLMTILKYRRKWSYLLDFGLLISNPEVLANGSIPVVSSQAQDEVVVFTNNRRTLADFSLIGDWMLENHVFQWRRPKPTLWGEQSRRKTGIQPIRVLLPVEGTTNQIRDDIINNQSEWSWRYPVVIRSGVTSSFSHSSSYLLRGRGVCHDLLYETEWRWHW